MTMAPSTKKQQKKMLLPHKGVPTKAKSSNIRADLDSLTELDVSGTRLRYRTLEAYCREIGGVPVPTERKKATFVVSSYIRNKKRLLSRGGRMSLGAGEKLSDEHQEKIRAAICKDFKHFEENIDSTINPSSSKPRHSDGSTDSKDTYSSEFEKESRSSKPRRSDDSNDSNSSKFEERSRSSKPRRSDDSKDTYSSKFEKESRSSKSRRSDDSKDTYSSEFEKGSQSSKPRRSDDSNYSNDTYSSKFEKGSRSSKSRRSDDSNDSKDTYSSKFEKGSRVYAKFTNGEWYWGKIKKVYNMETRKTFTIRFDDGDVRPKTPLKDICSEKEALVRFQVDPPENLIKIPKRKAVDPPENLIKIPKKKIVVKQEQQKASSSAKRIGRRRQKPEQEDSKSSGNSIAYSEKIEMGSRCYAKFSNGDWYWGRVTRVDESKGLYSVEFDDGDKLSKISREDICVAKEAIKRFLIDPPELTLLSDGSDGGSEPDDSGGGGDRDKTETASSPLTRSVAEKGKTSKNIKVSSKPSRKSPRNSPRHSPRNGIRRNKNEDAYLAAPKRIQCTSKDEGNKEGNSQHEIISVTIDQEGPLGVRIEEEAVVSDVFRESMEALGVVVGGSTELKFCYVERLQPASLAEQSGLKEGDWFLQYGQNQYESASEDKNKAGPHLQMASYDATHSLAANGQRPLEFLVARKRPTKDAAYQKEGSSVEDHAGVAKKLLEKQRTEKNAVTQKHVNNEVVRDKKGEASLASQKIKQPAMKENGNEDSGCQHEIISVIVDQEGPLGMRIDEPGDMDDGVLESLKALGVAAGGKAELKYCRVDCLQPGGLGENSGLKEGDWFLQHGQNEYEPASEDKNKTGSHLHMASYDAIQSLAANGQRPLKFMIARKRPAKDITVQEENSSVTQKRKNNEVAKNEKEEVAPDNQKRKRRTEKNAVTQKHENNEVVRDKKEETSLASQKIKQPAIKEKGNEDSGCQHEIISVTVDQEGPLGMRIDEPGDMDDGVLESLKALGVATGGKAELQYCRVELLQPGGLGENSGLKEGDWFLQHQHDGSECKPGSLFRLAAYDTVLSSATNGQRPLTLIVARKKSGNAGITKQDKKSPVSHKSKKRKVSSKTSRESPRNDITHELLKGGRKLAQRQTKDNSRSSTSGKNAKDIAGVFSATQKRSGAKPIRKGGSGSEHEIVSITIDQEGPIGVRIGEPVGVDDSSHESLKALGVVAGETTALCCVVYLRPGGLGEQSGFKVGDWFCESAAEGKGKTEPHYQLASYNSVFSLITNGQRPLTFAIARKSSTEDDAGHKEIDPTTQKHKTREARNEKEEYYVPQKQKQIEAIGKEDSGSEHEIISITINREGRVGMNIVDNIVDESDDAIASLNSLKALGVIGVGNASPNPCCVESLQPGGLGEQCGLKEGDWFLQRLQNERAMFQLLSFDEVLSLVTNGRRPLNFVVARKKLTKDIADRKENPSFSPQRKKAREKNESKEADFATFEEKRLQGKGNNKYKTEKAEVRNENRGVYSATQKRKPGENRGNKKSRSDHEIIFIAIDRGGPLGMKIRDEFIGLHDDSLESLKALGVVDEQGARERHCFVQCLQPGGLAEESGLKADDLFLEQQKTEPYEGVASFRVMSYDAVLSLVTSGQRPLNLAVARKSLNTDIAGKEDKFSVSQKRKRSEEYAVAKPGNEDYKEETERSASDAPSLSLQTNTALEKDEMNSIEIRKIFYCSGCKKHNIPVMSQTCRHSSCFRCLLALSKGVQERQRLNRKPPVEFLSCPKCGAGNAFYAEDPGRRLNMKACDLMEVQAKLQLLLSRRGERNKNNLQFVEEQNEKRLQKMKTDLDRLKTSAEQLRIAVQEKQKEIDLTRSNMAQSGEVVGV